MKTIAAPPWALILAGGDGTRLRALTRQIAGDPRPKQFCPLLDGETLLDRTRRRVDLLTRPDRQVVIVTRPHEPYFRPLVTDLAPDRLVVQPDESGDGGRVALSPDADCRPRGRRPGRGLPVGSLRGRRRHVRAAVAGAVDALAAAPQRVILLGIEAASPETEYGWIEPADRAGESESVLPIRRFWEKPAPELAASLLSRGCLWNSFVMVGRVPAFIDLIAAGAPELVDAFEPVRRALGSARERAAVERVYARLEPVNFSERVLEPAAARLGVVPVKGMEWSDWGNAERVFATMRRTGWRPGWLQRVSRIDGGLTAFPTALSA